MAIVVDKARPSLVDDTGMAVNAFTRPTPRVFPRGFPFKASVADPHIVPAGPGPVVGVAQSNYPVASMSGFWLSKVVNTHRFT